MLSNLTSLNRSECGRKCWSIGILRVEYCRPSWYPSVLKSTTSIIVVEGDLKSFYRTSVPIYVGVWLFSPFPSWCWYNLESLFRKSLISAWLPDTLQATICRVWLVSSVCVFPDWQEIRFMVCGIYIGTSEIIRSSCGYQYWATSMTLSEWVTWFSGFPLFVESFLSVWMGEGHMVSIASSPSIANALGSR